MGIAGATPYLTGSGSMIGGRPLPPPVPVEDMVREHQANMMMKQAEVKKEEAKLKRKLEASVGASQPPTKRRGRTDNLTAAAKSAEVIDLTGDKPVVASSSANLNPRPRPKKTPKSKALSGEPLPEKRLRPFRDHPPKTYLTKLQRVRTQRMFVVGKEVVDTEEGLEFKFDIVGTTGNLYKTVIGKRPTCDCPDSYNGNQCKHICYVLVNALKATGHLQYQLAFLSSELRQIYEESPFSRQQDQSTENNNGKRKPVEGDCPICFMELEPAKEEIVWCREACGNNIHKICFNQWAATERAQRRGVRCVYCRSPWEKEGEMDTSNIDVEELRKQGRVNEDGYVNVAQQMGLSGVRDYSTYHQPWGGWGGIQFSSYPGGRGRRYGGYGW